MRNIIPPTNRYAIKRIRSVREENVLLPGSPNPWYSLFPEDILKLEITCKSTGRATSEDEGIKTNMVFY